MGSSSEDIDQATSEKQATSDDNTGIGRSYECTFCKRGFTNAQALGGHMNIHRKDKAKAKVKNHQPNKTPEDHYANNPSNSAGKYYEAQQRPYSTAMAAYMSYQLYFPSSPTNPSAGTNNYLNGYNNGHHVDETGSSGLSMGPPHRAADHEEEIKNIGEVDLELRLGYQYP